ncbi:MAG: hypothetical protein HZB26_13765 [Candidatus Hydrogenedentes bacterium]|nr:hypothetical protein [Candidatus Hydrogenedentota bacterium]
MAFGDIGGAVTELVITCKSPASGTVNILKGDAVKLTGAYTVDNATSAEDLIFGQALASTVENGAAIPVKVRAVCLFAYTGTAPAVDGAKGVLASATAGKVKAPAAGAGQGVNVKVDTGSSLVHVLL